MARRMGDDGKLGYDAHRRSKHLILKQGFLSIKKEQRPYGLLRRVITKSWQKAWFILYRDPIFFEEFKDASLKSRKHIHLISVIKHVGPIRTSKSKQFAFEVIDDKSTFLLACDNDILLDEWLKVFIEVKNIRESQSRHEENVPTGVRDGRSYEVEMVDTDLSGVNELHGEYIAVITPTRMSLLDPETHQEALSWPISQITIHNHSPQQNRVTLIMGKNCHFGSGKLIFSTLEHHQMKINLDTLVVRKKKLNVTVSTPAHRKVQHQPASTDLSELTGNYQHPASTTATTTATTAMNSEHNILRTLSSPGRPPQWRCKGDFQRSLFGDDGDNDEDDNGETHHVLPGDGGDEDKGYVEPNIPADDDLEIKAKMNVLRSPSRQLSCDRRLASFDIGTNDDADKSPYLDILESETIFDGSEQSQDLPRDGGAMASQQSNNRSEVSEPLTESVNATDDTERNSREVIAGEDSRARSSTECTFHLAHTQNSMTEENIGTSPRTSTPCPVRTQSSPLLDRKLKPEPAVRRVSEPGSIKKIFLDHVRRPKPSANVGDSQSSPPVEAKRLSPKSSPILTVESLPNPKRLSKNKKTSAGRFGSSAEQMLLNLTSPFQGNPTFPSTNFRRKSTSRPESADYTGGVGDSLSVTWIRNNSEPPPLPSRESTELLHDLTITIKETKPPHTTTDVSPPADRHVMVHSSRSSFATPPNPDPCRPPPLPPKKIVSLTKSTASRDGSSDECVSRPSSVCSSATDTSVRELEHDGNAVCGNTNDDALPPAVPERDPVTVREQRSTSDTNRPRPSPLCFKPPHSKSLDSLSFVPNPFASGSGTGIERSIATTASTHNNDSIVAQFQLQQNTIIETSDGSDSSNTVTMESN